MRPQRAAASKASDTATGDTTGGGRWGAGSWAGSWARNRGLRGLWGLQGLRWPLGWALGEVLGRELELLLVLLAGHLTESCYSKKQCRYFESSVTINSIYITIFLQSPKFYN